MIWWNISNESSSTSSPSTGVRLVQTYANVVYQYCPYWGACLETDTAEAWMDMWGDGSWFIYADWYANW